MITIYKNLYTLTDPTYCEPQAVLESIRVCGLQDKVNNIRAEKDKKLRHKLKSELPCILFSGEFETRTDEGCVEHSGYAVMDIDKIGDFRAVFEKKEEITQLPFVYACFVSPSGDGLKVVVRIPPSIEDHRGHYKALMGLFPQSDPTSINLSRVCYASADADIYINDDAVEFTDYEDENVKLKVPLRMIKDSVDGGKHDALLRASQLVGGMIAGGIVGETEGIKALEDTVKRRGCDNFTIAKKTIRDGVEYGKKKPIEDDYVASKAEANEYIEQIRNGTFQMGLTTGITTLDEYFRFKHKNFVMINGHDNVGKSATMWYLSMLSAVLHDWKWIIHAAENSVGAVKRKLVEFYKCKAIKAMTEAELREAMSFVDEHYTFLKQDDLWSYKDLLDIGYEINSKKKHNALLIDPYNSLFFPEKRDRHEYDLRAMSEMRTMIKQTGCSIYLNCHVHTEALRKKYPKESEYSGYPLPPNKEDTEGGGKFASRPDDFLTIHRLGAHPSEWMITQIHVRKIKYMESGGTQTPLDAPVKLSSVFGFTGFADVNGKNPLLRP